MNGGEGSIGRDLGSDRQQMRRQRARPTADVEHLVARADPGKHQEDVRKRIGIAAHVACIGLRRDVETHQANATSQAVP